MNPSGYGKWVPVFLSLVDSGNREDVPDSGSQIPLADDVVMLGTVPDSRFRSLR